jgi:hypothetical protein
MAILLQEPSRLLGVRDGNTDGCGRHPGTEDCPQHRPLVRKKDVDLDGFSVMKHERLMRGRRTESIITTRSRPTRHLKGIAVRSQSSDAESAAMRS